MNNFPLIVTDESVDARITSALREAKYNILSVQEYSPGISDELVIQLAKERSAYIITEDKDFGDELVYRNVSHSGALLLRLSGLDINDKIRIVLSVLEKHQDALLNSFAVVNKTKLRIRNLKYEQ